MLAIRDFKYHRVTEWTPLVHEDIHYMELWYQYLKGLGLKVALYEKEEYIARGKLKSLAVFAEGIEASPIYSRPAPDYIMPHYEHIKGTQFSIMGKIAA